MPCEAKLSLVRHCLKSVDQHCSMETSVTFVKRDWAIQTECYYCARMHTRVSQTITNVVLKSAVQDCSVDLYGSLVGGCVGIGQCKNESYCTYADVAGVT